MPISSESPGVSEEPERPVRRTSPSDGANARPVVDKVQEWAVAVVMIVVLTLLALMTNRYFRGAAL